MQPNFNDLYSHRCEANIKYILQKLWYDTTDPCHNLKHLCPVNKYEKYHMRIGTSQITGNPLFLWQLFQANIKRNRKARNYCHFVDSLHKWMVMRFPGLVDSIYPCFCRFIFVIMSHSSDQGQISASRIKSFYWVPNDHTLGHKS